MIKPYYRIPGRGVLLKGDATVIMKLFPESCVDLTVTSPPYDNLRDYEGYSFDFEGIADELFRTTKPGGVVVWVVNDATRNGSESGASFRQALYFKEIGFRLHDTMIYQKNGPAYPSRNRYYSTFEYMFVLVKGRLGVFNPIRDRKNRWVGQKWSKKRIRRNKAGELRTAEWNPNQGGEYGVRFNVWKYNVGHGYSAEDDFAHEHPAIFPEQLAYDHIISWSNENDVVLDPMAGSGTVPKMALKSNRRFVAVEISRKYCDLAVRRVEGNLILDK